jgi:hypothetical protein
MKLFFIFSLVISINSFATNYYVSSSTGDDMAPGTIGAPWKSLDKINASSFAAGDSILFLRGDTWNGALNFPSSGTPLNWIYIGAYGNGAIPFIDGTGRSKTVEFNDVEFLTFSDIEVAYGDHGIFIEAVGAVHNLKLENLIVRDAQVNNCISLKERSNIEISNCTIYGAINGSGVSAYETTNYANGWASVICDNINIHDCTIYGNHKSGVFIAGHDAKIINNEIYENGAFGLMPTSHNIYLIGDDGIVENNFLLNSPGGNGFRYEGSRLQIKYNFIKNNYGHGISLTNDFPNSHSTNLIAYNIIIGNSDAYGILVHSNTTGLFNGINIYNNTLYSDEMNYVGLGLFDGGQIEMYNNIIDMEDRSIRISPTAASDFQADLNCFFSDALNGMHLYDPATGNRTDFVNWQNMGFDIYSFEANPNYVNSAPDTSYDFHLNWSSILIDYGTNVSETMDYFGNPFLGAPDVGACESPHVLNAQNLDKLEAKIYPNPSFDFLYLEFPKFQNQDILEVLSLEGKRVKIIELSQPNLIFDIKDLTKGQYILNIKRNNIQIKQMSFIVK